MEEGQVREDANRLLAELMKLKPLATGPRQKYEFARVRRYLKDAIDTGSETSLKLGYFYFAVTRQHINEVEEGKRKGLRKLQRKNQQPQ